MSGIGASVGGLRSTHWQLPKNVAFWLLALIYGLLLFSSSAPTPLYGVYQAGMAFLSHHPGRSCSAFMGLAC